MRAIQMRAAAGAARAFLQVKNRSGDIRVYIAGRLVDITPMWDGPRQRDEA
jgi:hypothetical protein